MAENRPNNKKKRKNDFFSDPKKGAGASKSKQTPKKFDTPKSSRDFNKDFKTQDRDFKTKDKDFKPRSFDRKTGENSERRFEQRKPFSGEKNENRSNFSRNSERDFNKDSRDRKDFKPRSFDRKEERKFDQNNDKKFEDKKPFSSRRRYEFLLNSDRDFNKDSGDRKDFKPRSFEEDFRSDNRFYRNRAQAEIRLNRYIAQAGICSRREADTLILSGVIQVNGKVVTELGFKIKPKDQVKYGDQRLNHEKKIYLLLNKPKDFITTLVDEKGRKTVMDLVKNACKERIFPVGRLDRNTTGVLLFTNDGDLAVQLTHPKFKIDKLYHVVLDKNIKESDLERIRQGLTLEDGEIIPDEIDYVKGAKKNEVGIRIHSGKNHIVRRIFDHLGYEVVKLDRVLFGNLTKADLKRGEWRMLTPLEVTNLQQAVKD